MNLSAISLILGILVMQGRLAGADIPGNLLPVKPSAEKAVVKVNGEEIKAAEVEALLWDWRRDEIISELIDDRIVRAAAKKDSLAATDAEVDTAMGELTSTLKATLPPGKTFEQAMTEQGLTKSRLWLRLRTEVLLRKIALKDFDAKNFVKISTIAIKPKDVSSEQVKLALERAEGAYKKLQANVSWQEVYLDVTDDPKLRPTLGAVGWRAVTAFPPQVQAEMANLKKDEVTKPAQTSNGFQIFKLDNIGKYVAGEDLRELQDAYYNGKRAQLLDSLRKEAKIERF